MASATIWKVFFLLFIAMSLYLFCGAFIFRSLESDYEIKSQERFIASLIEFLDERPCVTNESIYDFLKALDDALPMSVVGITRTPIKRNNHTLWDILDIVFLHDNASDHNRYNNDYMPTKLYSITVEPRYNEVLGTIITLLYQVSHFSG